MSAAIWLEPAMGGFRLCGSGRVPGSTWWGAHVHLTRGEALAALAAAIKLAAGATPSSAAALPAHSLRRGALAGPNVPSVSELPGTAGTGVLAVPTPQLPVGAVPRAERAVSAGHVSTGGSTSEEKWTRPAEPTTGRDFEINHS